MSRSDKSSTTAAKSSQSIYYGGIIWAFLAVMYFLIRNPGKGGDSTYLLVTALFEIVAFFGAAVLCLRNVFGSNSVSGKEVWLGLGLGLSCYCIGSCLFAYWEVVLEQSPDVSLGDLFYVPAYVFLIYGMVMAVIKRQLNLEFVQWLMVLMMGVLGIVGAIVVSQAKVSTSPAPQSSNFFEAPAIAYSLPAASFDQPIWQNVEVAQAPIVKPSASVKPIPVKPSAVSKPIEVPAAPEANPTKPVPPWAKQIDEALRPYKATINWIYVAADVCLVVIATALLTAFWGGRFSRSWQIIAFAAFSLYIADMSVKYASSVNENYNSGALPEVFFVFAAVLFGMGAALEHDLSQSRRGGRRRS